VLERFTLTPGSGHVEIERLADQPLELPRVNYASRNERRYRYVWGISGDESDWINRIVKADIERRETIAWSEDGCYPGEPVFVASPEAEQEDEGVLLSVVFDGRRETSFMLVLDAATLAERARAEVPHHIPFGFHGQFAAGAQAAPSRRPGA
jgi:carotenoid cleavage dioxygenase-like enzyme